MRLLKVLVTLLCAELIMSFRSFTRVPKAVLRTSVRMMSDAENAPRTYVDYTLFKSKGALSIKPIPATVKTEGNVRTIARDGTLLFEFAPAASASASAGNREFDWTKKLSFSLSPTELGEIVRMKDTDTVSLVHNPNLGGKREVPLSVTVLLASLLYSVLTQPIQKKALLLSDSHWSRRRKETV